jgi:hypothetical protein
LKKDDDDDGDDDGDGADDGDDGITQSAGPRATILLPLARLGLEDGDPTLVGAGEGGGRVRL